VSVGVPLVASPQIDWTTFFCQADPTSTSDIEHKMSHAITFAGILTALNYSGLKEHSHAAAEQWLKEI